VPSRRVKLRLGLLLVAIALIAGGSYSIWQWHLRTPSSPSVTVQGIRARTTPPNGDVANFQELERTTWTIKWRWEVRTDGNWDRYKDWLTKQLEADFKMRISESKISFVKYDPGDAYLLTVSEPLDKDTRYFKIEFSASAD